MPVSSSSSTFFDDPSLCGLPAIPALDFDFVTGGCSVSPAADGPVIQFPAAADNFVPDIVPPPTETVFSGTAEFVSGCDDIGLTFTSSSVSCPERENRFNLNIRIPRSCPEFSASAQFVSSSDELAIEVTNPGGCETCAPLFNFQIPCPQIAANACGGGMTVTATQDPAQKCRTLLDFVMPDITLNATADATESNDSQPDVTVTVTKTHRDNSPTCHNDPWGWNLDFNFKIPAAGGTAVAACMDGGCSTLPSSSLLVETPGFCCKGPENFFAEFGGLPRKLRNTTGANWVASSFVYSCGSAEISTNLQLNVASCNPNGVQLTAPGVGIWKNTVQAFRPSKGGKLDIFQYVCDCPAPCQITVCGAGGVFSSSSSSSSSSSITSSSSSSSSTWSWSSTSSSNSSSSSRSSSVSESSYIYDHSGCGIGPTSPTAVNAVGTGGFIFPIILPRTGLSPLSYVEPLGGGGQLSFLLLGVGTHNARWEVNYLEGSFGCTAVYHGPRYDDCLEGQSLAALLPMVLTLDHIVPTPCDTSSLPSFSWPTAFTIYL